MIDSVTEDERDQMGEDTAVPGHNFYKQSLPLLQFGNVEGVQVNGRFVKSVLQPCCINIT